MNLVNYIELFLIILCHYFRLAHITPIMWWQIIAGNQEYSIVAKSSSSSYEWMQFREMQMMHLESYLYIFFDIAIPLLRKLPFFDLMHLGVHFFLLPALRRMTFNFFPVWFERFFPCQNISIDIIQTCIVLCLEKWCKMHQNCTSTMSNIGSSIKAVVFSSEKALPIFKIEKKSTCFWTGW